MRSMKRVFAAAILTALAISAISTAVPWPDTRWPDTSTGGGGGGIDGNGTVLHWTTSLGTVANNSCMAKHSKIFQSCNSAGQIGASVHDVGWPIFGDITVSSFSCQFGTSGTWDAGDQVPLQLGYVDVSAGLATGFTQIGSNLLVAATGGGGDWTISGDDLGFTTTNFNGTATVPAGSVLVVRSQTVTDTGVALSFLSTCTLR